MAGIASLLGIVDVKKADGLVLATGEVPRLLVADGSQALTMPALPASVLQATVDEILPTGLRAMLAAAGHVEGEHAAGGLGTFAFRVEVDGGRTTVTFRRGARHPPPPPPDAAAPEAVAPAGGPRDRRGVAAGPLDTAPPDGELPDTASPAAGLLDATLHLAVGRRASDVLLSPGRRPLLRVDGRWTEAGPGTVRPSDLEEAFLPALSEGRRRLLADTGSVDLAFVRRHAAGGDPVRFRVSLFRQHTGLAAALRPLPTALADLAQLNLPPALLPIVEVPHGLVLVTGATGAGKSTTLAALLEHVNRTRACHVVTLEDPIEYVYRPGRAVIHQREIGTHVDAFPSGLRAALRGSPDIVLVGEMRDLETIRLALTAAETGHLVLSTLHSGTAAMAVARIVDAFDDAERGDVRQQLAHVLRHVVAQQLLATERGERIPVLEMLTVTPAVAGQIREGRTHMLATQMQVEAGDRMVTMERALAELVRAGRLALPAALAAAHRPEDVRRLLAGGAAGATPG